MQERFGRSYNKAILERVGVIKCMPKISLNLLPCNPLESPPPTPVLHDHCHASDGKCNTEQLHMEPTPYVLLLHFPR